MGQRNGMGEVATKSGWHATCIAGAYDLGGFGMLSFRRVGASLFLVLGVGVSLFTAGVGLASSSGQTTPEERKARGDELLRQMSQELAAAKVFAFTAEELSDKVEPGG